MNRTSRDKLEPGLPPEVEFLFPEQMGNENREACTRIFRNLGRSICIQHPELSFERLICIILSADVWKTVSDLERATGAELPAARNGAENLVVFAVDLGQADALIYRTELLNGFATNHPMRYNSEWQFLVTLASINFFTVVKSKFGGDPWRASASHADLTIFDMAIQLFDRYWSGYFSYLPEHYPAVPEDELCETLINQTERVASLFRAHENHADDETLFLGLHDSAMWVCGAMSMMMGYCHASDRSIVEMSPNTWSLIKKLNYKDLWFLIESIARPIFSRRDNWNQSIELLNICKAPNFFIEKFGVSFTSDGGTSPFRVISGSKNGFQ